MNEGETVTFVVTNDGVVDHEFRLANDELVEAHEHDSDHEDIDEMDKDMMGVLLLAPGETGELVVTFDQRNALDAGDGINFAVNLQKDIRPGAAEHTGGVL